MALVEEPHLRLLDGCNSIYELANAAIGDGVKLSDLARQTGHGLNCSTMTRSTTGNPNGVFCRASTIPKNPRAAWSPEPA